MAPDTFVALGIAIISATFYSGGFVWLTRTHIRDTKRHLAQLSLDVGHVIKGQKHQDRRISRIEGAMMVWTNTNGTRRRKK